MWSVFSSEVFSIRAVIMFLVCGLVGDRSNGVSSADYQAGVADYVH